jgi:hypothetical protein
MPQLVLGTSPFINPDQPALRVQPPQAAVAPVELPEIVGRSLVLLRRDVGANDPVLTSHAGGALARGERTSREEARGGVSTLKLIKGVSLAMLVSVAPDLFSAQSVFGGRTLHQVVDGAVGVPWPSVKFTLPV